MRTEKWLAQEIARQAGISTKYMVTRHMGEAFSIIMCRRLATIESGTIVILSFEGIELVDSSFCDEVFGKLVSKRSEQKSEYPVVLLHSLNEASLFNLATTLEYRRKQEGNPRTFAMPYVRADGNGNTIQLVGRFEKHIEQTFALLASKKRMTTRELSDTLGIDLADASTRLKTLYAAGLVARTRQQDSDGRHYEYVVATE